MLYDANEVSYQFASLNFEGNIIPSTWLKNIKMNDGKPDSIACMILAELVYWHRPVFLKDDGGNVVLKKKFKSDLLQKSYDDLSDSLGFSKRQCQDAMSRLEELGVLKRVLRTIDFNGVKVGNVLFIDLNAERIKEISIPKNENRDTYHVKTGEGSRLNGIGLTFKRETNTEITPEITNECGARTQKEYPSPQNKKKGKPEKISYRENIFLTESEHEKLLKEYGDQKLKWMLDYANTKIASKGYDYESHYHVLLPNNWVHDEYLKKYPESKNSKKDDEVDLKENNKAWWQKIRDKYFYILRDEKYVVLSEQYDGVQFRNLKTDSTSEKIKFFDPKFKTLIENLLRKLDL